MLAAALVLAVAAAYANSLRVPFVFDDGNAIRDNPTIRDWRALGRILSPPSTSGTTVNGRPLLNATLALNYAIGGTSPLGYHVFNLLVHALATLALFAVLRRILSHRRVTPTVRGAAIPLAFFAAGLWALHPLQTESVTYVVQRAEALAALATLLTLYCFMRGVETGSAAWLGGAVAVCAAGVLTKETGAVGPLLALAYDHTFAGAGWRDVWRRRRLTYAGFVATWVWLAALMAAGHSRGGTAGFGTGIPWWAYALKQCDAIPHYLRLSLWPRDLVLDYGIALIARPAAVAVPAILLSLGVAAIVRAWWRRQPMGFVGVAFLMLLAPTSSVVPVATQTMAEHRMYLPLAAIIGAGVVGIQVVCGRRGWLLLIAIALALGALTVRRNTDYRSDLSIWSDTVAKCPDNARALNNLGQAFIEHGQADRALTYFAAALRILPDYPETHNNLGYALAKLERIGEAIAHYEIALRLRPANPHAHSNLGHAFAALHRWPEAIAQFESAVHDDPEFADAHDGLGNAYAQVNRLREAQRELELAVRLDGSYTDAHGGLAAVYAQLGRLDAAIEEYRTALRLQPAYREAANNLGNLLLKSGRTEDAIVQYRMALRIDPRYAEAKVNLANVLVENGGIAEAETLYREAIAADANDGDAFFGLGNALVRQQRIAAAVVAFREAARLQPQRVAAQANLGNALLVSGRLDEAVKAYEAALPLAPDDAALQASLAEAKAFLRSRQ